jgi:tyrosinase
MKFITTLYPANRKASSVLAIDAAPMDAVIGEFSEVDCYSFTVTERGLYRIETEGSTDVVMSLFGPDSETRPIAADNDSGEDRNARIVIPLRPGMYTIRVRHVSAQKTGGYRISIKSQAKPPATPRAKSKRARK